MSPTGSADRHGASLVPRQGGVRRQEDFLAGICLATKSLLWAVATAGVRVLNEVIVRALGVPDHVIEAVAARERQELGRRERAYRGDQPPRDVRGRRVILVDDGLAAGATIQAGIQH